MFSLKTAYKLLIGGGVCGWCSRTVAGNVCNESSVADSFHSTCQITKTYLLPEIYICNGLLPFRYLFLIFNNKRNILYFTETKIE